MTQPPLPDDRDQQNGTSPDDADASEKKSNDLPVTTGRKIVWVVAIAVALYFIIQGVVGIVSGSDSDAQSSPAPTVTVTQEGPAPTPAVPAAAKGEGLSAFAQALPDSVRQYALSDFVALEPVLFDDALESYQLTFAAAEGEAGCTVFASQFATAQQAQKAAAQRAGEASGVPVVVGQDEAGVLVVHELLADVPDPLRDDVSVAQGVGHAVWSNHTAVFEVYGPVEDVSNVAVGYAL